MQTTTQISACDVVIRLDTDVDFTLADISGSSNSVTLNRLTQVSDAIRSFGSDFPIRQACGRDADITLRAIYSEDEAEAKQLLNDWYENHNQDRRTLQVDVPNSDPGSDRYTFEVYLASLNMSLESGTPGPVLLEASLKPSGTFTWAEIGS